MKRRDVTDLRADVQAHSRHAQIFVLRSAAVKFAGAADGDPELVLAQPGRDVRVRFSRHVGTYAQGNVSNFAEFRGAGGQKFKLTFAFHVEEQDSTAERQTQLVGGFAHAGKYYFVE